MSDIAKSIRSEWQNFLCKYGTEPNRLYLGWVEHNELRQEADQFIGRSVGATFPTIMTFMGAPVYEVNQERWLGFGLDCDSPCG